jgi:cation:H+ antiporter
MNILHWIADEAYLVNLLHDLPTIALIGIILAGIVLLTKGADWLIEGVVNLASRTGMPKIVIGATIVSLGTTMPEAFVSVMAAWMGNPGLALGNGVGSIIADTGLIFGLACVMTRIPMNRFILNRTGWVQVGAATLLVVISLILLMVMDGKPILGRWVGVVFLVLLGLYLYMTYSWAKHGSAQTADLDELTPDHNMGHVKCWVHVIGGLILVVASARLLIPSASEIAYRIGVPEDVIAATMVALGTSLPELMTAFASIRRGHPEIMVGNVVGADVLNCLFVIGAAAAAKPLSVPPNFYLFHFPAMLLILYPFRFFIFINKDGFFKRWQGGWMLGIYATYIVLQYVFNLGGA